MFNNDLPFNPDDPSKPNDNYHIKNNVIVDVSIQTTYLITEEYTLYIFIGGVLIIALFLLLIILILCYKRHKRIYSALANERRKGDSDHKKAKEVTIQSDEVETLD